MQNRLNKPHMEAEGNGTTRNSSKPAQTVLKKTIFFVGGGCVEGGSQNWNLVKNPHAESFK